MALRARASGAAQVVRSAHSLSGISSTVGLIPVLAIADPLDDLMHTLSMLSGPRYYALGLDQFDILERGLERMRGMLHQFAAGIFPTEAPLEAGALHDVVAVVRAHSALHDDIAPVVPHPAANLEAEAARKGDRPVAVADDGREQSEAETQELTLEAASPEFSTLTFDDAPLEPALDLAALVSPLDQASSAAAIGSEPDAAMAEQTDPEPSILDSAGGLTTDIDSYAFADTIDAAPSEAESADADVVNVTRVRDELDPDLLEVFLTEATDLLPAISTDLRGLAGDHNDANVARDLMRRLHTVKGSARMAGAMRLGEWSTTWKRASRNRSCSRRCARRRLDDLHRVQDDRRCRCYDELQSPQPISRSDRPPCEPTAERRACRDGHARDGSSPGRPALAAAPAVRCRRARARRRGYPPSDRCRSLRPARRQSANAQLSRRTSHR